MGKGLPIGARGGYSRADSAVLKDITAMTHWITRLHLWIGLVLGLQVLLWMASGVIMSWFPIDTVRGSDQRAVSAPGFLNPAQPLVPVEDVLGQFPSGTVSRVELSDFLGRPAYLVSVHSRGRVLFDATDGRRLSPIQFPAALVLAQRDYAGPGAIARLDLVEEDAPAEYRGRLPVWRASFTDERNTVLYLSPEDGRVLARRNDWWRVYDFFWMVHIMDYETRADFNTWLLRIASSLGLLFAATGLGLVAVRLMQNRYGRDVQLGRKALGLAPPRVSGPAERA